MIITISLLAILCLPLIDDVLAQSPHFVTKPNIISKTLLGTSGRFNLSLTVNFAAAGLDNMPLALYITSTGGISYNYACAKTDGGNVQAEPRVVFGPAKGQMVT